MNFRTLFRAFKSFFTREDFNHAMERHQRAADKLDAVVKEMLER